MWGRGGFNRRLEKPRRLLPGCITASGGVWADVGCGDGAFTLALIEQLGPEAEVHALDLDGRALRRLHNNLKDLLPEPRLHSHQADFTRPLDLPPLDGVLMANSLHFVPDRDKPTVLLNVLAALRSGGRFVLVEYNTSRGNRAVPHPVSAEAFPRLAESVGLQSVEICSRVESSFLREMYAGTGLRFPEAGASG